MEGESSRSVDGQDDANASFIEIKEHGDKKISEVIAGMIENLDPLPASPPRHCCIYKVSDHIRQSNEEAYTPQVIAIGPFYRNNPRLMQTMEKFKQSYLKSFMERAHETTLDDLVSTITSAEKSVRECYSETIPLGSDDFVKMILFDATFIIEFFWKNHSGILSEYDRRMLNSLLSNRGQLDLILLENQLPFFIIEKIYDTAFLSLSKKGHPPFIDLTFHQFQNYNVQGYKPREFSLSGKLILHFTDLLRHFCIPHKRRLAGNSRSREMHSATQLAGVGLKIKSKNSANCSPLELKYAGRVLEIPHFQLDETTEIYARNLIAFEQRHYPEHAYITDYYFLLRSLIISRKDMNFLVQNDILKLVDIVDYGEAISVLNRILENIDGTGRNNYYSHLAEGSNRFYRAHRTKLQKLMAILKRDYFRNPWRGAATIGGILLLLLTVTQTVCSLISVTN